MHGIGGGPTVPVSCGRVIRPIVIMRIVPNYRVDRYNQLDRIDSND